MLTEPASLASVLALLEARIGETRRCPRCTTEGAVIRDRSNELRRYCCKGCGKTLNALTGTPLARLRKKELWAALAEGLGDGDTVKGAAARCGVADTTSFRWRHRFLAAVKAGSVKLKGIVERNLCADQREGCQEARPQGSQAGRRRAARRPLEGAGADPGRGRSQRHHAHGCAPRHHRRHHHVPARNRHGPGCAARHRRRPVLSPGARSLGLTHEPLDHKAGERRCGDLHINSRHERLKTFLRGRRGVATKYLNSYLAWYHLAILPKLPAPRSVLASGAGLNPVGQPMNIANAN